MSPPAGSGAAAGTAPAPPPFLFVYGTLRRSYMLLPHQLRHMRPPHLLDTRGEWVGTGVLRGHQLWDVGAYPGMVKGEAGDPVVGDVFRVQDGCWEALDRYEGIAPEYTTPQEYTREVVEIEMDGQDEGERKALAAWVYVYNWPIDKRRDVHIDDGDYVQYAEKRM